ncbi:uncharacterized protein LOC141706760 isoform X2 [Apium graveolens]|uniref:uncharacterized protein LOC141706760 isoform X2 n=1 Tax=Apium graveolens TaxID=4045 RepID=UPI003D7A4D80
MATTSNHGNQLSQSEDYEQFMECFNHMAVSITHPSVEPMFFFNKENYNNWIVDKFIYCRNHDITERYLACIHYNAVRLDCEQSLMVIRQYSSMEDLDNMELPTHL